MPFPIDEDIVAALCELLRPTEHLLEVFKKGEMWTHVFRHCLEGAIQTVLKVLKFCDRTEVNIPKATRCLEKIFQFDQNSLQISGRAKPYFDMFRPKIDR